MRRLAAALCVLSLSCQREPAPKKRPSVATATSGEKLDGMQLDSARRVAIESATAAMQRRDLPRLKQLATWVRGRAHVPVLEPNDLTALDLAIRCLEDVSAPEGAAATLDELGSGKLKKPALELCASR
jgi:hypothetical protein